MGGPRSDNYPAELPCGCLLKNAQGAWIAGKHAPTQRQPDGTRVCRHGRRWRLKCVFVEILNRG